MTPITELALFTSALALPDPAARGLFLERARAGNSGLCHRLDELLSAHDRGSNPLDSEPVGAAEVRGDTGAG